MRDDGRPHGRWVQTERAAHEEWSRLILTNPSAAQLMHILVAHMGGQNRLVISQAQLAKIAGKSRDTVKRAIAFLRENQWLDVRPFGERGGVCAYIINDQIAWSEARDKRRYSLFSAAVYMGEEEQPPGSLGERARLRRVPVVYAGEQQLPSGPGLPATSQPFFDGFEPDLPAATIEGDGGPNSLIPTKPRLRD